ncbi:uncharacterized protein [Montipora capricornis]|uniref:uncharacterized protein isoform X1 n=1 Tax=Montipora capricornis TaxID=246305 RepID=UPI0035F18C2A
MTRLTACWCGLTIILCCVRCVSSQTSTIKPSSASTLFANSSTPGVIPTTFTGNASLNVTSTLRVTARTSATFSVAHSLNRSSVSRTTFVFATATLSRTPGKSATATLSRTPGKSETTPTPTQTSKGTGIWNKAIEYATPLGTFIIVIVSVALFLIFFIAFIVVCYKYRNLKKKTRFPDHMTINDSEWIRSSDDLLMWERNLRASEMHINTD